MIDSYMLEESWRISQNFILFNNKSMVVNHMTALVDTGADWSLVKESEITQEEKKNLLLRLEIQSR